MPLSTGINVSVPVFRERIPPLSMAVASGHKSLVDKILALAPPKIKMVSAATCPH